jgi:BASS family bile acid:Na+ symporter
MILLLQLNGIGFFLVNLIPFFELLNVLCQFAKFRIKFIFSICCRPLPLSVGFIAQYVLKPGLGVLIAKAFGMSQMFFAGFVLTSCVAGAQLSSYASFLSKGDVALSILLTSSTTIASVLFTPLLTGLLIGSVVPVDAIAMSKSILQVMRALY